MAVASETQVFIVTLELFLRWLFVDRRGGGEIDRKNEHADSSQVSLF